MSTTTITITLHHELAQIYYNASAEERQKIEAMVRLWLRDLASSDRSSLSELMDTLSDKGAGTRIDARHPRYAIVSGDEDLTTFGRYQS